MMHCFREPQQETADETRPGSVVLGAYPVVARPWKKAIQSRSGFVEAEERATMQQ
jgi:hypothetical protein